MYNIMENIPDYITLFSYNANKVDDNKIFKFDIPASYYTKTRGNLCYLSLEQFVVNHLNADVDMEKLIAITLHNQGQNCFNNLNEGCILGLCDNRLTDPIYMLTSPIKVLISARPSSIEISLNNIADNSKLVKDTDFDNFCLVLKFEYLHPQETQKEYVNSMYRKL